MYCYFEDEDIIYLILEHAQNGQLFRKLITSKGLPIETAAKYFI